MPDRKLIYVADPMCSWCWGFSPVIRDIVAAIDGRVEFAIILGGLRSETGPVPEERKAMYREIWPQIEQLTGQRFDCGLVESADFIYDTEPPCRAVVAARTMAGDLKALELFERLQTAFYTKSLDITQHDGCVAIAADLCLDSQRFSELFTSDAIKQATQQDFQQAAKLGITGFPTVLVANGQQQKFLTRGYQPFEMLRETLEQLLE